MSNTAEFYPAHWRADGYGTDESDKFQVEIFRKMFPDYEKYVAEHTDDFDRVLDVGCGDGTAGYAFFREVWHRITYHGIDPAGIDPAYEYFRAKGTIGNVQLTQTDLFKLRPDHAHWVFCVGVLHYLPDMGAGLARLVKYLYPGGHMVLWVYKKQPPIRELTDQYLRSYFSAMSPENAKRAIEPLTKLGMQIGELSDHATDQGWGILLTEDVDVLGLRAGSYSVHELFYYYIMKLFHHPTLPFERHVVNNWNAYYPNPVEFIEPTTLRTMLGNAGLDVKLWNDKGNGIAVIAEKRAPF